MTNRCLFAALSMLAPWAASVAQDPIHLSLGLYSFKKPTEVYKQFQPVAVALSKALTAELKRPANVELQIVQTYEECLAGFVAGKIDIVRFGPASYVLAKKQCPGIELLAAEREDASKVGLIVVRDDSPVKTLADLKGRRFAFGDQQSTIGRYLSQAELVQAGVTGKDLAAFDYLERHDIVFKAVEIGDYDAGALHADTFHELNEKEKGQKLRVLHPFDNVAKPWIARAGLQKDVVQALRSSLKKIDDPAALKALKVPGFATTVDGDYELVRKGMCLSEKFAPTVNPATVPAPAPAKEPAPGPAPGKRP